LPAISPPSLSGLSRRAAAKAASPANIIRLKPHEIAVATPALAVAELRGRRQQTPVPQAICARDFLASLAYLPVDERNRLSLPHRGMLHQGVGDVLVLILPRQLRNDLHRAQQPFQISHHATAFVAVLALAAALRAASDNLLPVPTVQEWGPSKPP
jgi:hypothetical protein